MNGAETRLARVSPRHLVISIPHDLVISSNGRVQEISSPLKTTYPIVQIFVIPHFHSLAFPPVEIINISIFIFRFMILEKRDGIVFFFFDKII